jgi:hypothetical protein
MRQLKFLQYPGITMLTTALLANPLHAWASSGDGCAYNPHRMNMVVQLTRTGEEKVTALGFEYARQEMDKNLQQIPKSFPPFGADPNICKKEKIYSLSPSVIKDKCFGLVPVGMWDGDRPDAQKASDKGISEPIQMSMNNFAFRHLNLHPHPKIQCKNNVCQVDAKIDSFDIGFDFKIKSVNESCSELSIKKGSLGLDQMAIRTAARRERRNIAPSVHLEFRFSDNLAEPIAVNWNKTKINLSAHALRFDGQSETQGRDICAKNPNIQRNAVGIAQDAVIHNQFVLNMVMDTIQSTVIKDFTQQQLAQMAQMNAFGVEQSLNVAVPNLGGLARSIQASSAQDEQLKLARSFLKDVRNARGTRDLMSARARASIFKNIDSFGSSFRSADEANIADSYGKVADIWDEVARSLRNIAAATQDAEMKNLLLVDASSLRDSTSQLRATQQTILARVKANDPADQLIYEITALQAGDLKGEIESKVSACYKCQNIQSTGGQSNFGFDSGTHDLAFKTSYKTFNQVLEAMYAQNKTDMCFVANASRECQDALPSDSKVEIHFGSAPEVFWDTNSGSFAIRVHGLRLKNTNKPFPFAPGLMTGDVVVPVTLSLKDNGQSIHFEPIQEKMQLANPQLKGGDWAPRFISGIANWVGERLLNHTQWANKLVRGWSAPFLTGDQSLTSDLKKGMLPKDELDRLTRIDLRNQLNSSDPDVPLELPKKLNSMDVGHLTDLKPTPDGIGVYLKLPENPLNLMPQEDQGTRTLAGRTGKLK